ncbi:MAG: hypothetical protein QOH69_963 [Actinomycetota bacterium]|nr:hypothetical protein [Actinomycetota bacterium]
MVAALTDRLRAEYSDVATFDLKYLSGYLSDLFVIPAAVGGASLSLVGLATEFVFTVGHERYRRWEIANNVAGRAELDGLIADVIEGRMGIRRGLFGSRGYYAAYR